MSGAWSGSYWIGNQAQPAGIVNSFTADSSAHTIPDWDKMIDDNLKNLSRIISAVRVLFDGTTPPNSLTVTVKDGIGVTIASGTLTATGIISMDTPVQTAGGMSVTLTGNTTNSAEGTVELLFLN